MRIETSSSTSRCRLVVFDLDGTLVDSLGDLAESANTLLESCGGRPLTDEAIGRMVGDGAPMLVARVFEAAGVPRPPEALDQFLTIYNGRLLRLTRPYPGIPEVLAEVEGRAQLAVLTNKPRDATQRILAGLDLARFFSNGRVIGGDGPLPRKPDPRGLVHLVSDAGVAPDETLLVGDSAVDCRTARAAETRFCAARYGFGFQKFPVEELRQEDRLIDRPNELLSFL